MEIMHMDAPHDPADQAPGGDVVPPPQHAPAPASTSTRRWSSPGAGLLAAVALAGLLAGALSWGTGEMTYNHFRPSDKAQSSRYEFAALVREEGLASQKNAAVA